jgi:hypothetical protein
MSKHISIPSNTIIIGQTRSSKTHSFTYLFKQIAKEFSRGIVICSTAKLNFDYDFMDPEFVHDKYDEDIIKNAIEIQENEVKFCMEKYGENDYKKHIRQMFIIIDDAIGVVKMENGSIFDELFSKSRHLGISCFILIQHITKISPCVRVNSLYIGITKITDNNIDTVYNLMDGFESKKQFRAFLNKNCVNYQLIWCDKFNPYSTKKIKVLKFPKKKCQFKLLITASGVNEKSS